LPNFSLTLNTAASETLECCSSACSTSSGISLSTKISPLSPAGQLVAILVEDLE
jgi:hypothetical protein